MQDLPDRAPLFVCLSLLKVTTDDVVEWSAHTDCLTPAQQPFPLGVQRHDPAITINSTHTKRQCLEEGLGILTLSP
jgi:hypothetical protein